MQFTNKSGEKRAYGVPERLIAVDETIKVTPEQAEGFVLQCGEDGMWAPADDEATAAVEAALTALQEVNSPTPVEDMLPSPTEAKKVWIAFAKTEDLDVDEQLLTEDYKAAVTAAYTAKKGN